ncbi:hypothetical protein Bca4012_052679 [Brassica carinata]|uniref:Uncharacterized protein n=1 Tax=Brassica carinata TaxID=52824 RepID=A0A8X7UL76_BRACI|nr:hypothetical protein Bca52824_055200 [Brassica carinata]
MGRGRCRMVMCCEPNEFTEPRPYRPPALKRILFQQKRLAGLREGSQVSLEIQSDKSLKGTDQDQTTLFSGIDIQEKSSSDVVASTSKPQTPSSSLVGMKKTLGSQVSLLRCSACMQIIQSDKSLKGSSDQDQTTLVSQIDIQDQTTLVSQIDIQEKLSSDIVSNTSKTHQGKHLRSSSKIHKPKALLKKKKKKKKKKSSRKAVSTT